MNSGSGQQQKRILIIDDEPDVNIVLQTVLEQNGFKTDSYTDPVAAHKNFGEGLYDLVILDIRMPVIDGFLLYQKKLCSHFGFAVVLIQFFHDPVN